MMLYLPTFIRVASAFTPSTTHITTAEEYAIGLTSLDASLYWMALDDGAVCILSFDTLTKESTCEHTDDNAIVAIDLHTKGRRLACGNQEAQGVVDCETRDLLLFGDNVELMTDVNGDGWTDILGIFNVYIQGDTGFEPYPYPDPFDTESWYLPLHDLNNDGNDDIAVHTFLPSYFLGYFYVYEGSRINIFAGGADGYAALPERTIDFDGPMLSMVALQADTDPERELLVVLGDRVTSVSWFEKDLRMVLVDLPPNAEATIRPVGAPMFSSSGGGKLIPFEDIDGDGLDEVVLLGAVTDGPVAITLDDYRPLRVLTPANDFDPFEPLLLLDPDLDFAISGEHAVITDDVNEDGRRDITMISSHYNKAPPAATINVWYAPWFEPDPVVEDTAPPTDTSTTGDTATPPTPQSTTSPPKEGCGCTFGVSTPWFPLSIRQRSNVSRGRQ